MADKAAAEEQIRKLRDLWRGKPDPGALDAAKRRILTRLRHS